MSDSDDSLSSVVFFQPQWIAMNGGWIHSNNVLFYFAQSPFFDRASANQNVIVQSQGIPEREFENLSTRHRFEHALSKQIGVQYVVEHDPLESKVRYKGPDGEEQSDVWVIRRQQRSFDNNEESVKVTGYYYIMNQAIFQAPSVQSILNYRLLNTTRAMDQIFAITSELPIFTVSHGHTYHKPNLRTSGPGIVTNTHSKEPTPMPDTQVSTQDKADLGSDNKTTSNTDVQTLRNALSMSMHYGREYMDDMQLTGEPGNFRFVKTKEASVNLLGVSKSQVTSSKAGTPAPASRVASPPPAIQTDVPPVASKKSSAKSPGSSDPLKPKRRKSKVLASP